MKHIFFIAIVLLVCGCNAKQGKDVNENATSQSRQGHNHEECADDCQELANLPPNELRAMNRNISKRMREDYRSWSARQPERWPGLAGKFADEAIRSCPGALGEREKLEQLYLQNLGKRVAITQSDAKDKKLQMNRLNMEFIYNLKLTLGIEGYQKWEVQNKAGLVRYNQMRDSIHTIIAFSKKITPKN